MTLAAAAGVGIGIGGSKAYKKITGKTAGEPASLAHILTNDKLDKKAKKAVIAEQFKESGKDTLKLAGIVATTAGATAIATGCSNKITGIAQKSISKVGNLLSKVSVNGNNLKDMIASTKVYQKISTLPTPAKAAMAVGGAVLALVAPIMTLVSSQKAGYIEGKHEAK